MQRHLARPVGPAPEDDSSRVWEQDGLRFEEIAVEEYANCSFSAGKIAGHVDTVYLAWERWAEPDEERPVPESGLILLRPDEMAALLGAGATALRFVLLDELPLEKRKQVLPEGEEQAEPGDAA